LPAVAALVKDVNKENLISNKADRTEESEFRTADREEESKYTTFCGDAREADRTAESKYTIFCDTLGDAREADFDDE
jgi:hypothetical protein